MWPVQPIQRHLCAFFLTAACITSFVKIHEKLGGKPRVYFTNETDTGNFFDLFSNSTDWFQTQPREYMVLSEMQRFDTHVNETHDIYFLGLFELSTQYGIRHEGYSEMSAARLAVDHVNKLKILPGYNLKLLINDTKVMYYIKINY